MVLGKVVGFELLFRKRALLNIYNVLYAKPIKLSEPGPVFEEKNPYGSPSHFSVLIYNNVEIANTGLGIQL